MGKDLKGKELGEGLSQRKNGKYSARFRSRSGKRIERYFDKYHEAKKWLADSVYEDSHNNIKASSDMLVDTWFEFWIENYKRGVVRDTTYENYIDCYNKRIKPYIGDMVLSEVKPLHCQNLLNQAADKGYAYRTITGTRNKLHCMFESALENDLIAYNPVTKSVKCKANDETCEPRVLTVAEQALFLKHAQKSRRYQEYRFVLQTGIRCGELMGLKWADVDMKNRIIHIRRTLIYLNHDFVEHLPKTKSGMRDIPLTQEAYDILTEIRKRKNKALSVRFYDNVFVNSGGMPTSNSNYMRDINKICRKAGLEDVSMHTLRHTFATRCIEAGMNPKTLQKILGHSTLEMTMNLYVHVTDDTIKTEMARFEKHMGVKRA